MAILGIDYGTAHIGLALATGPLAEPLSTTSKSSSIVIIKHLINHHQITRMVIGQPDVKLVKGFSDFVASLEYLGIPISFVDETLTSQDATNMLLHKSQSSRKQHHHAASAALILQFWLDSSSQNNVT